MVIIVVQQPLHSNKMQVTLSSHPLRFQLASSACMSCHGLRSDSACKSQGIHPTLRDGLQMDKLSCSGTADRPGLQPVRPPPLAWTSRPR